MIHYLSSREHLYTLEQFLTHWAPDLASRITPVPYEDIFSGAATPQPGTYIFADLERLSALGRETAVRFRRSLGELGDRVRVLNDPTRVRLRYDLLRTLYDSWINSFNAYRVTEARRPKSWPVILRREFDHEGPIGKLLENNAQLDDAKAALVKRGERLEGVIAVEFRNTADAEGLYRKYGAFVIGGRVIPRHVLFSRHWCVKNPDLLLPEHIEEELQFVRTFPRAEEVRKIFQLARIDYGRIDYGFYGDRLQVWEINTNPFLVTAPSAAPGDRRRETNDWFTAQAREAFLALDAPFAPQGA